MIHLFPSRTVALEFFGFGVHWYGVMYVLAFVLAILLLPKLQKLRSLRLTDEQWLDAISWGIIGVLVGGRLGYVFFYDPAFFLAHPLSVFAVWEGGMASHGGFIGVAVALWLWARKYRISPWILGDLVSVPAGLGLALGRIGNFINQELYGTVTTLPWGMNFPGADGLRHPIQLYEMLSNVGIALVCFLLLRQKNVLSGRVLGLFLILYGIARFLLEYIRDQQYPLVSIASISLSRGQLLTLPLFAIGVMIWVIAPRLEKRSS